MRAAMNKLFNNILSTRALSVLGLRQYLRYLANFIVLLPKIVDRGDLNPLDAAMSGNPIEFRYRNQTVRFDTGFCDQHIHDGTYAFGITREIYIRDCYFRHLPQAIYQSARTVVDLGANRGAFSVLFARKAKRIVCIEAKEEFASVINHNLRINGFDNASVFIAFIGQGGRDDSLVHRHYPMAEFLDAASVAHVDLLKIDIEGSEYAVFSTADHWLHRVSAITMEVHPAYGQTRVLLDCLERNGFDFVLADENLNRIGAPDRASFVYAWKPSAVADQSPHRSTSAADERQATPVV